MRIKVLHLIDSGGLYGAEKMLLSLVQEQIKQGLEPMILSAGELGIADKPVEVESRQRALPITPWRMSPGFNARESWEILKWAKNQNFDLLHSHGFKFNVLMGIFPERFRGAPLVATMHGHVNAPRFSKLWFYEAIDRFAIRRMRSVAVVAESMKKDLSKTFPDEQVVVIPNGLDVSGLEEVSQLDLDEPIKSFVNARGKIVLGIGRLSKEKGFDRLIEGFSIFHKSCPDSGLVIVGEGVLRKPLEELINSLSIEADVLMPGYCSQIPSLLSRASVLVMPSSTEGLPIALLEAMSMKTPVIATAVGEIPNVLSAGAYGEILTNVDPDTIAESISRHIDHNHTLEAQLELAYNSVGENYSSETMARQYLQFYRQALEKK